MRVIPSCLNAAANRGCCRSAEQRSNAHHGTNQSLRVTLNQPITASRSWVKVCRAPLLARPLALAFGNKCQETRDRGPTGKSLCNARAFKFIPSSQQSISPPSPCCLLHSSTPVASFLRPVPTASRKTLHHDRQSSDCPPRPRRCRVSPRRLCAPTPETTTASRSANSQPTDFREQ